jgi:hypothetical protein
MPFWNRPRISPDFIAVPHEPSAAERAGTRYTARDVVAFVDSILDGQQTLEPEDRNVELIDVLLDVRNLLAVPVTPGRSA